jgi:D-3-phosphoglycerate dehydrogenase
MPVLVFDFDSTLVSVEGLDELFARTLVGAADEGARLAAFREITDLGMAGQLTAEESLARRLAVLDADRKQVRSVGEAIREFVTPSVARHRDFFKENRDRIYVLSGGFEELIHPTLEVLDIPNERLLAHRFLYDERDRIVGLDPDTAVARGGKPGALRTMPRSEAPLWAIGDGATDLELRTLGLVDRFVAFTENRSREPVVAKADAVARSMDDLLTLLESE